MAKQKYWALMVPFEDDWLYVTQGIGEIMPVLYDSIEGAEYAAKTIWEGKAKVVQYKPIDTVGG